ncbi:MAG TPA: response regulator transcription factor [Candidatus Baltobacteraceae bacterium]|jgi:DNA-binding response OmpR family regulator|nr:response regulator transcription factor [Candidatus Baltobacteraceae bacterium]
MALARILVVEDDEDVARLEQTVLERAGYEIRVTGSGAEGLELADTYKPDVVILDVGLPDISGLDVCTSLSNSNNAFILMVSGHSREQDILLGLGLGADDYITKPFSGNELVARVASFLRRREKISQKRDGTNTMQIGSAQLDRDFHSVANNGDSIALTALEFRLLWFLAEAEGRLLTRAQILEHVWNDTSGVPTRVVDVHVAALRKKLTEVSAPLEISSVRGIGYRLDKK